MLNFKQALKIDPSDFYARFWLGQACMMLGEYDLASQQFQRLKSAWPRDRQQVKVLAPGGQLDQTADELRKKSSIPTAPLPTDSAGRARRSLVLGDFADAMTAINGLDPSERRLLEIGVKAASGQVGEAMKLLDNIESPQTDWLRAWLAIQAGDRETARNAIAAGKAKNPSPTTALELEHLELMLK